MADKKVKYIIREGVIDKFMGGIMNWAVKKTSKKVDKMIKKDPKLAKLTGQLKKDAEDLRKYLEKEKKSDKNFAQGADVIGSLWK